MDFICIDIFYSYDSIVGLRNEQNGISTYVKGMVGSITRKKKWKEWISCADDCDLNLVILCRDLLFLFVTTWHFVQPLSTCPWGIKTLGLTLKVKFIHGSHLYSGKTGKYPRIITRRILCKLQSGWNITLFRRIMVIFNISSLSYSSKSHCLIVKSNPICWYFLIKLIYKHHFEQHH